MIYSIFLALLMSLGYISSDADYQDLTPEEQQQYEIIINDIETF